MRSRLPLLARRLAGAALLAPLVAVVVWALQVDATCDIDCGDSLQGAFLALLVATPLAAVGVELLVHDLPGRARAGRILGKLTFGFVALCALLLAGATVAAAVDAVGKLTGEPNFTYVGNPGAAEEQYRSDGWAMLVTAGFLAGLATAAVVALRRAWRRLRTSG